MYYTKTLIYIIREYKNTNYDGYKKYQKKIRK